MAKKTLSDLGMSMEDAAKALAKLGETFKLSYPVIKPRPFTASVGTQSTKMWTISRSYFDEKADPENFMVIELVPSPLSDRRLEIPSGSIPISVAVVNTLYALNVIYIKDTSLSWSALSGIIKYELSDFGKRCKLITQNGHYTEIWIPIEVL